MYTMRAELKSLFLISASITFQTELPSPEVQYRATQRAQQQERKVMDANKRFSSVSSTQSSCSSLNAALTAKIVHLSRGIFKL